MNRARQIKLLLMLLNRRGLELNYETTARYSKKFDAMITSHFLKFWNKRIVIDEKTGEEVEKYWCKTVEIKNEIGLLKYLVKIKDNEVKAGSKYEEAD